MNEDDEIITVQLPRWKAEILDKIAEERKAYDVVTGKIKTWWFFAVAAGSLSIYALYDTLKVKVGG